MVSSSFIKRSLALIPFGKSTRRITWTLRVTVSQVRRIYILHNKIANFFLYEWHCYWVVYWAFNTHYLQKFLVSITDILCISVDKKHPIRNYIKRIFEGCIDESILIFDILNIGIINFATLLLEIHKSK